MFENKIELKDRVLIRGRETEGEFVVTQMRGTVGILSANDELQVNKPGEGVPTGWVKRSDLILLRKATSEELDRFGW